MATDANTTPVSFRKRRAVCRIGSAQTSSPSSRGGNASNATSPTAGSCASASNAAQNISVSTAA